MLLPPAVIIHDLPGAELALSLGRPVTLLSAPAAGLYGGCLWWFSLLQAAQTQADMPAPALLDCADAAGRAVEALRMGLKGIVLDGETPAFAEVAALAAHYGALLLAQAPPALDLAVRNAERNAERKLAAWLSEGAAAMCPDALASESEPFG